jgi:uncharacterized repeat protein (TIGR03943 family)
MNHSRYRLLQITVLAGLGFFFFRLINSGKLLLYINNRFAILSFLGMIVLFMLAANALEILNRQSHALENVHDHHDHEHHYSAANIFWLALPLALGLLIPVRPLGADAAANKGVTLSAPLVTGGGQPAQLAEAPDQRNVLDWIRLFNTQVDLSPHLGETANVVGFVYEDSRLPAGHFLVARFTVSCCVADAFAIGMAVEWSEEMVVNSWVNVRGPVDVLTVDGQRVPLIRADQVVPVDPPDQPYLYP